MFLSVSSSIFSIASSKFIINHLISVKYLYKKVTFKPP
nr:MAG TPA: hypothetical protein [Caudoviricetes sp.]